MRREPFVSMIEVEGGRPFNRGAPPGPVPERIRQMANRERFIEWSAFVVGAVVGISIGLALYLLTGSLAFILLGLSFGLVAGAGMSDMPTSRTRPR